MLLRWCYFNPFSPTLVSLYHAPVPGTNVALLVYESENPFAAHHSAFGLLQGPTVSYDAPSAVIELFARDGFAVQLPTSVVHRENWTEDEDERPILSSTTVLESDAKAARTPGQRSSEVGSDQTAQGGNRVWIMPFGSYR